MAGNARLFAVTATGSFAIGLLLMGPVDIAGQVGPLAASAWEHAKSFAESPLGESPVARPASFSSASGCDPNYSGTCVPMTGRDVDCAGKGGDGPLFVQGPFYVVGDDVYNLDADGDGIACEPFRP